MTRSLHDPKGVHLENKDLNIEDRAMLCDSTSSQMSLSNYQLSGAPCGGKDHNASDTTSDTASATSASGT